jgi:hypothetical protein
MLDIERFKLLHGPYLPPRFRLGGTLRCAVRGKLTERHGIAERWGLTPPDGSAILEHCRGPGPHVRGCWVVDLILGKE